MSSDLRVTSVAPVGTFRESTEVEGSRVMSRQRLWIWCSARAANIDGVIGDLQMDTLFHLMLPNEGCVCLQCSMLMLTCQTDLEHKDKRATPVDFPSKVMLFLEIGEHQERAVLLLLPLNG